MLNTPALNATDLVLPGQPYNKSNLTDLLLCRQLYNKSNLLLIWNEYTFSKAMQTLSSICIWLSQFNILRSEQNGGHFAEDNLKYIFLNWNVSGFLIKISLKFVPKVQLIRSEHWFRWWLGTWVVTSHNLKWRLIPLMNMSNTRP